MAKRSNKKKRGYTFLDFNIHKALDWDHDKIILALDVIRKKFCETPDLTRHGLSAHIMPHEFQSKDGKQFPVIGLIVPTSKYFGHFGPLSITSLFDNWRRSHQVKDLLDEAAKAGIPTWEQLLQQETFPIDPRSLY